MLGLETEEEAGGEVFQVVDAHLIFQILGWSIIFGYLFFHLSYRRESL